MTAPFFDVAPVVTAIPVGLAFGVALERAGFGVPRTIAAQLAGRDFTVMKVMFSAIVTAMLGLFWAERLGWLDVSRLSLPPTDLFPQLVGAIVFGAGFAIASLCPGTACVAAGTGRRDGLATIAGLFLGTLLAAELWPWLGRAAENHLRLDATLPHDLGWSKGITVALLTAIALLAIWCGGWIERRVHGGIAVIRPRVLPTLSTVAIVLALLAAAPGRAEVTVSADVAPLQLAQWLHDRAPGLRLIEVSDSSDGERSRIPGSERRSVASLDTLTVAPGERVVLYSEDPAVAAEALAVVRRSGTTSVETLRGGVEAWENEVMSPVVPSTTDSATIASFARVRSLSAWFGGRPVLERRTDDVSRKRRRNTC
ncbi:MAG: YeeE/YedE thiosulfate transporter family protein [Gemmatimonadales bacterium]